VTTVIGCWIVRESSTARRPAVSRWPATLPKALLGPNIAEGWGFGGGGHRREENDTVHGAKSWCKADNLDEMVNVGRCVVKDKMG
jgi:hypothetical protein